MSSARVQLTEIWQLASRTRAQRPWRLLPVVDPGAPDTFCTLRDPAYYFGLCARQHRDGRTFV